MAGYERVGSRINRWRRADDICVVVSWGMTGRVLSHRRADKRQVRGDKADEQVDRKTVSSPKGSLIKPPKDFKVAFSMAPFPYYYIGT